MGECVWMGVGGCISYTKSTSPDPTEVEGACHIKLCTDTGSLVLWITVPCGEGRRRGGEEGRGGGEEGRGGGEGKNSYISHTFPKHDVLTVLAHFQDSVWSEPCWCPEV